MSVSKKIKKKQKKIWKYKNFFYKFVPANENNPLCWGATVTIVSSKTKNPLRGYVIPK